MLATLTIASALAGPAPSTWAGGSFAVQRQFLREPRDDWAWSAGAIGVRGGVARVIGRAYVGKATQGTYLSVLLGGGLRTPGNRHDPYLLVDLHAGYSAVWGSYGGPTGRVSAGVGVPWRSGPKPRPPTGAVQVVVFGEGVSVIDGLYEGENKGQIGVAVDVLRYVKR